MVAPHKLFLFIFTSFGILSTAHAAHLEGDKSFTWETKIAIDQSIREQKRRDALEEKLIETCKLPTLVINFTGRVHHDGPFSAQINLARLQRTSRVKRKKPRDLIYESSVLGRVCNSPNEDTYSIELKCIKFIDSMSIQLNTLSVSKHQDGQIKGTIDATQKLPYDSTRGYQSRGASGTFDNAAEVFAALVDLYHQELHQEAAIFFAEIRPTTPIMQSETETSVAYFLFYYVPDQCHRIQHARVPQMEYFPHVIMAEKNTMTGKCCFPNMQPQTGKFRPLASDHAEAFFNTLERLFLEENLKNVFEAESRGEWFKVPYESVTCEVFEEDSDDDITFLSTTSSYSKERT